MSALIPALIEAIWGPAPLGKLIGRLKGDGGGQGAGGGSLRAKSLIKPDTAQGVHPQILQGLMTPYKFPEVTPGVYGPRKTGGR